MWDWIASSQSGTEWKKMPLLEPVRYQDAPILDWDDICQNADACGTGLDVDTQLCCILLEYHNNATLRFRTLVWSFLPSLNTPRYAHTMASLNGKIKDLFLSLLFCLRSKVISATSKIKGSKIYYCKNSWTEVASLQTLWWPKYNISLSLS
jgi:hypothetical protein